MNLMTFQSCKNISSAIKSIDVKNDIIKIIDMKSTPSSAPEQYLLEFIVSNHLNISNEHVSQILLPHLYIIFYYYYKQLIKYIIILLINKKLFC